MFLVLLLDMRQKLRVPRPSIHFQIVPQPQMYVSVVLGFDAKKRSATSLAEPDPALTVGKIKVQRGSQLRTCETN